MTKKKMWQELETVGEFLEEVGWQTDLLEEKLELPALVATLPLEEDYEEALVFNYIPMPEEEAEFTKLLQIYARIPLEIEEIPREGLYRLMNQLNLLTTFGQFVLLPDDGDSEFHLGMRYVLGIPMDELPDEGVIGEVVLHMTHYCQVMEGLLIRVLADGISIEDAVGEIKKRL